MSMTVHSERVASIQRALQEMDGLDGWLFYDFRGSDPLAYRVLLLDPGQHVTRRWYYWIPATGEPVKLLHRIEPHVLDELPGHAQQYVSWEQQRTLLSSLLRNRRRIAMQYSPLNAVPYLARLEPAFPSSRAFIYLGNLAFAANSMSMYLNGKPWCMANLSKPTLFPFCDLHDRSALSGSLHALPFLTLCGEGS
ncbi:MAG: hypothetical protein HP493_02705 [Nitrospira sp.]|nr:hypothetical protein [Nitrospira sp.]